MYSYETSTKSVIHVFSGNFLNKVLGYRLHFFKSCDIYKKNCLEWIGYNTRLCRESGIVPSKKAKTVYVPLIHKIPNNHFTMNIALRKGAKFVRENGQPIMFFTVDMQLYKIVTDILFYQPVPFQTIVPIMVGFIHI